MSARICPLNNRRCRCDPNATDKKFHPCVLTRRIGKLVRLMASSFPEEAKAAATGLMRLVAAEGASFNDLATLIENCDGQVEERKYSDADAEAIFARGQEKGRAEEAQKQAAPPEFYDADGEPRWYEIAVFCDNNKTRLHNDWEENFIADMPSKMMRWGKPKSSKQGKIILGIFVKLGGMVDPKILQNISRFCDA